MVKIVCTPHSLTACRFFYDGAVHSRPTPTMRGLAASKLCQPFPLGGKELSKVCADTTRPRIVGLDNGDLQHSPHCCVLPTRGHPSDVGRSVSSVRMCDERILERGGEEAAKRRRNGKGLCFQRRVLPAHTPCPRVSVTE